MAAHDTGAGVRAEFDDGSEAFGDLLVGCDGVHSTVRRLIDPTAPAPSYAGLINTGGYASGVSVDTEPGSYEMIFGKRAFFGYLKADDGQVWWFSNVPRRDEPARGELAAVSGEEWRRRMLELYAEDAGPAVSLIEATPEIMPMTAIHSIPHLPRWHNDRMIVVGDAAHAPSPSSGQGASLAIEDGVPSACGTCPPRKRRSPSSLPNAVPGSSASSRPPPASTTTRRPARSAGCSATPSCR